MTSTVNEREAYQLYKKYKNKYRDLKGGTPRRKHKSKVNHRLHLNELPKNTQLPLIIDDTCGMLTEPKSQKKCQAYVNYINDLEPRSGHQWIQGEVAKNDNTAPECSYGKASRTQAKSVGEIYRRNFSQIPEFDEEGGLNYKGKFKKTVGSTCRTGKDKYRKSREMGLKNQKVQIRESADDWAKELEEKRRQQQRDLEKRQKLDRLRESRRSIRPTYDDDSWVCDAYLDSDSNMYDDDSKSDIPAFYGEDWSMSSESRQDAHHKCLIDPDSPYRKDAHNLKSSFAQCRRRCSVSDSTSPKTVASSDLDIFQ